VASLNPLKGVVGLDVVSHGGREGVAAEAAR
jgi:hypothetical protein